MNPTDPTLAALQAALESLLWGQLLVIADRWDDLSEPDVAEALRWLAREKLMPLRFGSRWHWRQWGTGRDGEVLPLMHQLPAEALEAMRGPGFPGVLGCRWNERETLAEAYVLAARALAACKRDGRGPLAPTAGVEDPESGWLCHCGAWMDHDFHCDDCGNEPPWGCACCAAREEDEADPECEGPEIDPYGDDDLAVPY